MTRVYVIFGASFASGSGFAGRQLYLQSLPADQAPVRSFVDLFLILFSCEALSILLRGDGNCAEVAWQFLGISIHG